MKLSKRLLTLIENFKTGNPSLASRSGARGRCSEASVAFCNLTREDGLRCNVWYIVLDKDHDQYFSEWYPDIEFEGHCVVFVEGVVIDWTARQYNPAAPFPLIYRPPKKAMDTTTD